MIYACTVEPQVVKLLTTPAMVDNLAEKIDKCPLNQGRRILLVYNWDCKNCLLYGVVGSPLFRGCLSIEVKGRTVGTVRIVRYIMGVCFSGVSVKRGSTVFLYTSCSMDCICVCGNSCEREHLHVPTMIM